MKNIKILSIFLMLVIVFAGCKKDDYTGHSQLTPTNPTVTVDLGTIIAANDGVKSVHTITLNMDVAQIVDVAVQVFVVDGTATEDVDFSLSTSRVIIPAGKTEASVKVTIIADEDYEETETFQIQIGDDRTANASITPVFADFTINNFTSDDLKIGLSWANLTQVFDPSTADEYSATDLADMILTVYDLAGDSVLAEADGGSFEELVLSSDLPDGTYRVATSFYGITDEGVDSDLDFTLNFYQIGQYSTDEDYPAFLSLYTFNTCVGPHMMMDVEKSGTSWTWSSYVDPQAEFLGAYGGTDGWETDALYPSEVVTTVCGNDLFINGLNHGWMFDWWGEIVTESIPLLITLNPDNTISIDDQYYMSTTYNGAPQTPYDIVSVTGTWAAGGVLHIEYELSQGGWLVSNWGLTNGYSVNAYYVADITLGAKNSIITPKKVNINKPKR